MSESKGSGHRIVMFPWFAFGHMTPFLHFANILAEKGNKVTLLFPKNSIPKLEHFNHHPDLITLHPLTVPAVDGLPPGAETCSDVSFELTPFLATAMDRTRDQFDAILKEIKPALVMYDFAHWVPEVARVYGIKTINYCVVSAASLAIAIVPSRFYPKDRAVTEEELFEVPKGYPSSTIVLRRHEAKSLMFIAMPFGENITFYERGTLTLKECDAITIRTCSELEGKLCDYMGEQYKKPVFLTGPVLPEPSKEPLEENWANWLSGFGPGSVVYCAFGSQIVLKKDQFQELCLGFESTGLPFLVALKILNTRLLADELKLAVEVERDENGWFSKETLGNAIKSVMDKENPTVVEMKNNHDKWRETLTSPNFMRNYTDKFIQDMENLLK
ncbi:hypothetical protein ACFE04_023533 [Oxalis oulophora]